MTPGARVRPIGRTLALVGAVAVGGCSRAVPDSLSARAPTPPAKDSVTLEPREASPPSSDADAPLAPDVIEERGPTAVDGPHFITLEGDRPIYYAFPTPDAAARPWRLLVNLHGTCGGPSYSTGSWVHAAVEVGAVVSPTGNAHCGPSPLSPPTWEAPSWMELVHDMDESLERSIAKVARKHPHAFVRDGEILTGYSRGGYAVPFLATMHPGRWPLLLIIEADATLDPAALRRAKVRAVSLVAGEWGDQIAGMRKSAEALDAASFPARLFVMHKTAHLLSDDIEDVMRQALGFLVDAPAP